MKDTTNARNEPLCPLCARGFEDGEPVVRSLNGRDMVHMACAEESDRSDDSSAEVA
jgi:hypothetical protein